MSKKFTKPASGDAAGNRRSADGNRSGARRTAKSADGEKKVYNRREKPARGGRNNNDWEERPARGSARPEGGAKRSFGKPERGEGFKSNRFEDKESKGRYSRSRSEAGAGRTSERPPRRERGAFAEAERGAAKPYRGKAEAGKSFKERGERPFKRREEGAKEFKPERKFSDRAEKPAAEGRRKDDVLKRYKNNRAEVSPSEAPNYKIKPFRGKPAGKAVARDNDEKDGKIRLNRYIANAGICSRREADNLIASGEIKVNGEVITEMGYLVNPSDTVTYGRKVLNRQKMVYVLLNKPKDFITTTEDPEGRKTVMDLVANATSERIFPVGRLDRNTTGLLLFTNDGELAQKLTHPAHKSSKIYQVELDKPVTNEDYKKIVEGVELEDGKAEVDDVAILSADKRFLGLEIHIGRNRIVRRIFEHLGYEVVTLDRVQFSGLTKKDLPRGQWRFLSEKEVIRLKFF